MVKKFFSSYLIFLLTLFFYISSAHASTVVNKIVAVVGNEVLTLYELDQMVEEVFSQISKKNISPEEAAKLKESLRRDLLERWIEDTVVGLEARKYGIKVTDEEVEHFIKEELAEAKREGQNLAELKEMGKERLIKIKFIQLMVRDKIAIPEEELKIAYREKIKNYDPSPKYQLEILLIREDLLLKEIYEKVLQGKAFSEIVREYREHTKYFAEIFKEEEIDKILLAEIKKLKAGEVTEPIKRGEVYQIIRLIKKDEGVPPSFEEMKRELYEELFQKRAKEYLEKWIKELKESKFVKVYL